MRRMWAFLIAGCLVAIPALATTIDFESYGPGIPLGPVTTPDGNVVTFGVGLATPTLPAYTARIGDPVEAFVPADTPSLPALTGQMFLTDEYPGPVEDYNYFITFAIPVTWLGLHIIDYRRDGDWPDAPVLGSSRAILTVYSDPFFTTPVGQAIFTLPTMNPYDGNVEWLEVTNPSGYILSAKLEFEGTDPGTAIDNITFTTVPEPVSMTLVGVGLAGFFLIRRRSQL